MDTVFSEKVDEGAESVYASAQFLADGTNKENYTISLTDRYVGTIDGNGAVDAASDWTKGWTK